MTAKISSIRVRKEDGFFEIVAGFDNDRFQAIAFSEDADASEVAFHFQALAEHINRDENLK